MKKIKLSNTLLIGLAICLLILLVWQAYFSKGVLKHNQQLEALVTPQQQYEFMKQSSHFESFPLEDIKTLTLSDQIPVKIVKGEENILFVNKYKRFHPNPAKLTGRNITIENQQKKINTVRESGYMILFLRDEPEKLIIQSSFPYWHPFMILGFNGGNMQIENYSYNLSMLTDLKNIHITRQKGNSLRIDTREGSTKDKNDVERNIFLCAESTRFELIDNSGTLSIYMHIKDCSFSLEPGEHTFLKSLDIEGTVGPGDPDDRSNRNIIYYPGRGFGDAVSIRLSCSEEGNKAALHVPEKLLEQHPHLSFDESIEIF